MKDLTSNSGTSMSLIEERSDNIIRCSTTPRRGSMFDLPAMPLVSMRAKFNHLIYISMFTPIQRAMHGRRAFIFSVKLQNPE
jgi:hypothetical protein